MSEPVTVIEPSGELSPCARLNEIERDFDSSIDGGFSFDVEAHNALLNLIAESPGISNEELRVYARFWQRGFEVHGNDTRFVRIDDFSEVFTPMNPSRIEGGVEGALDFAKDYADGRFANAAAIIRKLELFVMRNNLPELLKNNSLTLEVNHQFDDTPGIIMGFFQLAYHKRLRRMGRPEDGYLAPHSTLVLGPRILMSHHRDDIPTDERVNYIGNHLRVNPPTPNAEVPGAEEFMSSTMLPAIMTWRRLERKEGNIIVVNRGGSVDDDDGNLPFEPRPEVFVGAAPKAPRKLVLPIYFTEARDGQHSYNWGSMAIGEIYEADVSRSPEEYGRELVNEVLYGDLRRSAQAELASKIRHAEFPIPK